MEIHLLGAVELSANGTVPRLGSDRERCLLASLALDVGRPVARDVLAARLWDEEPPEHARANLHTYISRLRRVIRDAAEATGRRPDAVITLRAHSYTLEADPEIIDWHRYLRLSGDARAVHDPETGAAAGTGSGPGQDAEKDARALALFEDAESLWVGEALAGLPGVWAHAARTAMTERRLTATHAKLELRMRLRQFADMVSELTELTEAHPMDETLARHLMVALYGSGRHADSLAAFQRTRRLLQDRLGTDPGERLTRTHSLILRQAPLRELVPDLRPEESTGPPAARGPRNLPRRQQLVGREGELNRLLTADAALGTAGSVITIEAISGMAGVGKSALALHAAYRLGDRYPDGQIFIDLHTHSASRPPMTPEAGLTALLRAFGIPPGEIPHDLPERTALWRTVLTGKRAVIVLDDAQNSEQVVPLLPDDSASLVLITSRHRLTELPSARPMFVDVLPLDDAIGLFRRLVGPERANDPAKIEAVVKRCALLPLAVEIVASRFKARPSWNLGHLIERLSRRPGRLLEIRDGHQEMAAAFELSYNALSAPQRAAFRRLSLHPGPDFGAYAAAAIIDEPLDRTERLIEDLLECHLLQEPRANRYRFHDLLAEYATLLAESEKAANADALLRLTEYALRTADRADRLLRPHRFRLDLPAPAHQVFVPSFPDAAAAHGWLDEEMECLLSIEQHARRVGHTAEAAWLAHALADFAESEGYWHEAVVMHRAAVAHWNASASPRAESRALLSLAAVHARASQYPRSAEAAERALALARDAGDDATTAEALNQLGVLHWHVSECEAAVTILKESLELRGDDRWNRARTLNNLAIAYLHMGDHRNALESFTRSLQDMHQLGDLRLESRLLSNIGDLRRRAGDIESARTAFQEALALNNDSGSEADRATIRMNIATTMRIPEEFDAAVDMHTSSLAAFRRLGDRKNEASALNGLGTVYREAGRHAEAAIHHDAALRLARELGVGDDEAAALRGLGIAAGAARQLGKAREYLEAAATVALRIRVPDEEALACDALAGLLLDDGRPEEARGLWRRALALFEPFNDMAAERIRETLIRIDRTRSNRWQREA
ncbi:tetratricopeptide repeat protein [Streptomyces sp. NPDC008317]|uniref:AfsR/SARP family transcriptional regulator n=1 Tax=Streptomyces sp. NPDC008317 TaxID=3364827 RepID=UPI0036EF201D